MQGKRLKTKRGFRLVSSLVEVRLVREGLDQVGSLV
jgi:hypothetical protein